MYNLTIVYILEKFGGSWTRNLFLQRVPTRSLPSFGMLGLRGRVRVNFVAMVRVSKLLGSNINPNPNSNSAHP